MKNYIVKFKNDLKQFQITRKKLIKQCESELTLLERLARDDISIYSQYSINKLYNKFTLVKMFASIESIIYKSINGKKREKRKSLQELKDTYIYFFNFYQYIKKEHITTQNIINAYENDKIKDPINNISILFAQMSHTTLSTEEISKIIGMAISFNSQYAKKHKDHKIENIDIINKLSEYYNQDGTFKYNEDVKTFSNLMKELDDICLDEVELLYRILNLHKIYFYRDIVALLKANNQKLRDTQTSNINLEDDYQSDNYTMSPETRKALQELKKYYKNGIIIAIPENLEEFYTILKQCELTEAEQKYIINLINEQIANKNGLNTLKYLNNKEQKIYQRAISLLDSFTYSNSDVYALKQYIEELQTISQMIEIESDEENKEYLLSEVPAIMEQLTLICNRYETEDKESSNRFIFLLNKEGIPHICDDIDSLDQSYRKAICSLIPKIEKSNQSQFRKILTNEQLPYSMYELISPRAHVAFIEIDSGIYLIVGANIPRAGYKELINRLKANLSLIKQIENNVKKTDTRNQILLKNEEYLTQFTEQNNQQLTRKLELKTHN